MGPVTSQARNVLLGVVGLAALVSVVLIVASLVGSGDDPVAASPAPAPVGEAQASFLDGIPQDGITLGDPAAPVTVVEFADLQCPFCADFANDTVPAFVERYVRTGDVKIVFRGLAFLGEDSDTALRAVLAAGRQGKLWNMVELLYAFQGAENSGWVTDELLREVAARAGVDADAMFAAMDSEAVNDELVAANQAADAAAIDGTPSFLAGPSGGELAELGVGALTVEQLAAAIDPLLAR
jgi:protein-disulfide isomerase